MSEVAEFVPAGGGHCGEVGGHGDDIWAQEQGLDGIAGEDGGFEGLAVEAPLGGEVEDDCFAVCEGVVEGGLGVGLPEVVVLVAGLVCGDGDS